MRTTLLVCVAAAVAMIQANILLVATQNQEGHTITLDLMRLPLGILTGVELIGGGAILRRDGLVQGVTTAATLWLVTVIGLCFRRRTMPGLGAAATAIGFLTLWGLKRIEPDLLRARHGTLVVERSANGPDEAALEAMLQAAGFAVNVRTISVQLQRGNSRSKPRLRYSSRTGTTARASSWNNYRELRGYRASNGTTRTCRSLTRRRRPCRRRYAAAAALRPRSTRRKRKATGTSSAASKARAANTSI